MAVEARMRVHGLPDAIAAYPEMGTVLGLLEHDGTISRRHRKAGERYGDIAHRCYNLEGIPLPYAKAMSLEAGRGGLSTKAEDPEKTRRACDALDVADDVLMSVRNGRAVRMRVWQICVAEMPARGWPMLRLAQLRDGLEALAVHWQLDDDSEDKQGTA